MGLKQSKAEKMIDQIIERAYGRACVGVMLDIMDIGKVFNEGRRLILKEGVVTDEALQTRLRAFVDTIAYKHPARV